jgi:murein DD-endopeptidase MepM/ murein hydrolase activator NlpD
MREEIDKLNDRLMIDQSEYLRKIDDVRLDYERLVDRHRKLVEFFRQGASGGRERKLERKFFDEPLPANPREGEPSDSFGLNGMPDKNDLNEESFAVRYGSDFRTKAESERPLQDLGEMFRNYERMEIALLDEAIIRAEKGLSAVHKIFTRVGLDGKRVAAKSKHKPEGVGGPFIAAAKSESGNLEVTQRMERVFEARADLEKLKHEARRLPVVRPLVEAGQISSRFGIRRDPFRRTLAMHAGVDFTSGTGTPVLATADGRVVSAGWEGAYGRMIEISHDNGVSTRYAHLSEISVSVGQQVANGSVVGKIGSTGRSTGPHLHYETRVNRRAMDPARFWQLQDVVQELRQEK